VRIPQASEWQEGVILPVCFAATVLLDLLRITIDIAGLGPEPVRLTVDAGSGITTVVLLIPFVRACH